MELVEGLLSTGSTPSGFSKLSHDANSKASLLDNNCSRFSSYSLFESISQYTTFTHGVYTDGRI